MRQFTSISLAILLGGSSMPSMLSMAAPAAPAVPKISHHLPSCIPSEGQAALSCDVTSISAITSVRVYFRSEAFQADYFLEMRRSAGDQFYAVLPHVEPGITKAVTYRIVVKNAEGAEKSTEQASVPVSADCPHSLSAEESKYGANLVPGLTVEGQSPIPQGFKCQGVVSVITAAGELKPNEDCRKAVAAAPHGATPWIIGGVVTAAFVGGAAIVISNSGGGGAPVVSSARRRPSP